jgi:ATP-dependent DNA helicase DinG
MTSATLAIANNFDLIKHELGLDELAKDQLDTIQVPSTFDYKNNSLLYIPRNMPDPKDADYYHRYLEEVLPVLQASQGRAFLLFSSFNAMHKVYELLNNKSEIISNLKLFIQNEGSKNALLKKFREHKNSVLLATGSFWEGIDVKGADLHCVIIDKLPFATPDDPIMQAKIKIYNKNKKNAFLDIQCQSAALQLVQGAGRLIRSETDYGVLMICDPRIVTRHYGKIFLRSLPPMAITRDINKINQFYSKFGIMTPYE